MLPSLRRRKAYRLPAHFRACFKCKILRDGIVIHAVIGICATAARAETHIRVRKDKTTCEVVGNTVEPDIKIESALQLQEVLPITDLGSKTADAEIIGIEKAQLYLASSKKYLTY